METRAHSSLYRAVWRWHFYAGLIVMPFLVLLAITGGLYLFKPELETVLYRSMIEVSPRETRVPTSALETSVERALDGEMLQMLLPDRPDRSVQALVRIPSGEVRTAYVDPYGATFLGSTEYGGVMQLVRKVHSLQLFGFWASSLMEIAAGWAIIMVLSGLFLWWPRGARGGVVSVRGPPAGRLFWRDIHAVTGAFAGVFILFLAVTGMPWSMFWGNNVQGWAAVKGLSRPAPPAEVTPAFMLGVPKGESGGHDHGHSAATSALPWAMQQAAPPHSHHGHAPAISIDYAVKRFAALGVPRPYGLQPPEGPHGAWSATYAPDQVENVRLVYLDQYTGGLIGDVGYTDFGPAAKTIEWGIAVHQGQQYGPINRYLMLAACVAIVLLAISAIVMWWKRRPQGRLGVPPMPDRAGAGLAVALAIAVVGVIYPLTGLSFLIALAAEWIVLRMRRSAQPRSL